VVIGRDAYGPGLHRYQPAFLDFAKHHGFVPRLCKPYRAKTKGKVERFNGYLRRSFYNPLASRLAQDRLSLDATTANAEVVRWLRDVANVRIHGTTGQSPLERLLL
ncbi:TPA: transposase, partial [Burkholderia multivorans]|nr:transposase [Burkholderia multivorans]